jgi:hypothetical protein
MTVGLERSHRKNCHLLVNRTQRLASMDQNLITVISITLFFLPGLVLIMLIIHLTLLLFATVVKQSGKLFRRRKLVDEEYERCPSRSSLDEDIPPVYTDYPREDEMRIPSSTPPTTIDCLSSQPLDCDVAAPPCYSTHPVAIPYREPQRVGHDLFERSDAQTLLNTTENYLAMVRPKYHPTLSSSLTEFLRSQSGDNMLLPGWLMRITSLVHKRTRERYNVLVLAVKGNWHFSGEGIIEDFLVEYGAAEKGAQRPRRQGDRVVESNHVRVPFRILVFREGVVIKCGSQADTFWDWRGRAERIGERVIRFRICV